MIRRPAQFLLFAVLCLLASPLAAEERILHYRSDIQVHADGWLTVTETLRVRAEGQQIRRGIYRDFPNTFEDADGNKLGEVILGKKARGRVGGAIADGQYVRLPGEQQSWLVRGVVEGTAELSTWVDK